MISNGKTFRLNLKTSTIESILSMGFVSSGTLPAAAVSLWSSWAMQWAKVSTGTYRATLPATRQKAVLSRLNLDALLQDIY